MSRILATRSVILLLLLSFLFGFASAATLDKDDNRLTERSPRKAAKAANRAKCSTGSCGKSKLKKAKTAPVDVFCRKFTTACYDVALSGRQAGQVQVKHACQRLGKKFSVRYQFSCVVDGSDQTQAVLAKTGGGYTITTTVQGSTRVITGTVTETATSFSTSTVVDSQTSVSTLYTTDTSTETTSLTDTTITTTTTTDAVPTTLLVSTTATTTFTVPTVLTTTSTETVPAFLPTTVPVTTVVVRPDNGDARRKKRFTYVDSTTFCQEFTAACSRVCTQRAQSNVRGTICRASKQDPSQFGLGCYCEGGKVETQHALADAAEQQHVEVVTTVATSSTTVTQTTTNIVPTTITSTTVATVSTVITGQATVTSSVTATVTSTSVSHTSTPTTISTTTATISTTTVEMSTTTLVIPTTTQLLLAPSGYVGVYNLGTSIKQDVLSAPVNNGIEYGLAKDQSNPAPIKFIAVKDANGPLYKLMHADGTKVFTAGGGSQQFGGYDYEPSGSAYTNLQPRSPTQCGSASTTAGLPAGDDGTRFHSPCEQYVFNMRIDALTPSLLSFNATFFWINPAGSATANTANLPNYYIFGVQSPKALQNVVKGDKFSYQPLYDLRFPVATTT